MDAADDIDRPLTPKTQTRQTLLHKAEQIPKESCKALDYSVTAAAVSGPALDASSYNIASVSCSFLGNCAAAVFCQ